MFSDTGAGPNLISTRLTMNQVIESIPTKRIVAFASGEHVLCRVLKLFSIMFGNVMTTMKFLAVDTAPIHFLRDSHELETILANVSL